MTAVDEVDLLDDVLDEALDHFVTPPPKATLAKQQVPLISKPTSKTGIQASEDDNVGAFEAELMRQLAENMEKLLTHGGDDLAPLAAAAAASADTGSAATGAEGDDHDPTSVEALLTLERLTSAMKGMEATTDAASVTASDVAGSSGGHASPSQPLNFQDKVAQTMNKLRDSSVKASSKVAEDIKNSEDAALNNILSELEQMMDSDELEKVIGGLMDEVVKKDVLYEPMKDLVAKYPDWLDKNRSKLSAEETKRYEGQLAAIQEIVVLYESKAQIDSDEEGSKQVMELLAKVQEFGNPPDELLKEIAPDLESGSPDGKPGDDPCKQM